MIIIDNKTMTNGFDEFAATHAGEELATWSVETEYNSYADDEYNGTYEEAKAYAMQVKADHPDMDVQIALVALTHDGSASVTIDMEHIG